MRTRVSADNEVVIRAPVIMAGAFLFERRAKMTYESWNKKVQEQVKDFFGIRFPSREFVKTEPRRLPGFEPVVHPVTPQTDVVSEPKTVKFPKTTVARTEKHHVKEFVRIFKDITYRHNPWEIWKDFITMFACALSNAVDKSHYDEREALYMSLINKYNKSDQPRFSELAAETVMALDEDQEQDFLGKIFMELNLGNDATGQIFTPYGVCRLMADISMGDILETVDKQGYVPIHDPCCGAGATLIAGVHAAKRQLETSGLNYQNHVFAVAQDIDATAALMCYIQLSLLGVAGGVKIGNSLTEPILASDTTENYWFTPMYFSDVWATRRALRRMDDMMKEAGNK